jgi:hypothetical protein
MATKIDDNKTFWLEFIALYQTFPELWKVKSEVYKNRIKKDAAYKKLVKKMKEIDPQANRDLVRAKINSLRTSYRRELKKVKSSQKSGAGADDIYEPSLWYYYEIDFLRDQETQLQGTSTLDSIDEIVDVVEENNDEAVNIISIIISLISIISYCILLWHCRWPRPMTIFSIYILSKARQWSIFSDYNSK